MPTFDINNNMQGDLFGHDRIGHTTPDSELSETLRPFLTVPYPAPYLPTKRSDQGHPVLASVVLTAQELVGLDSSGAIVPAGLFCGSQAAKASGGQYCALKYSSWDTNFTYNALTGVRVSAAGQVAVLAAPSDGAAGDVITFADGTTYTVTSGDVTAAHACTLFPGGVVTPIGLTIRNAWQYIGGVTVTSTTGGMQYLLDGVVPVNFPVLNFKYEMGIPVQTEMVIRVPWIGALENTLTTLASGDGVTGFTQGYGRSFIHFVGTPQPGQVVVAARGSDANGNYTAYNSTVNSFSDIVGKVIGVQAMYPIKDYANRVRTLFNPNRLVGPIKDPNPVSMQMGGSATAGMPYQLHLTTDGIFQLAYTQGKTLHPEYYTYVNIAVRTF